MTLWEYTVLHDHVEEWDDIEQGSPPPPVPANLAPFGQIGWELVAVTGNAVQGHTYFLKRPLG